MYQFPTSNKPGKLGSSGFLLTASQIWSDNQGDFVGESGKYLSYSLKW